MDLASSFDPKKNKHSFERRKDWTKKFSKDLNKQASKIINFKEKNVIPLTDEETEFYEKQNVCHICQKEFCNNKNEKKNLNNIKKIIVIIQENLEDLLIAFVI